MYARLFWLIWFFLSFFPIFRTTFGERFCIKPGSAIATAEGDNTPIAVFISEDDLCSSGESPSSPASPSSSPASPSSSPASPSSSSPSSSASPPPPPSPSPDSSSSPPVSSPPPIPSSSPPQGSTQSPSDSKNGASAVIIVAVVFSVVAFLGLSAAAVIMWKRRGVSRNNSGGMADNYDGYGIPLMQNDFHSL